MPNDDKLFQKFLDSMKKGLKKENGGKYGGTPNQASGAMGKYQFVPKYFWDKKPTGNLDSIPDFAIKKGYGKITKEDFLKNPALQEEYFETYIKKEIYPKAKELYSKYGEQRNLRIDEIGSLLHFQGVDKGSKIVAAGKHLGETKINPSTKEDLIRFNKALSEQGSNGVPDSYTKEVVNDDNKNRAAYSQYKKELDSVTKDPNLSRETKNLKIDQINERYFQKGYFNEDENGNPVGIFNNFIKEENVLKKQEYDKKLSLLDKKISLLNEATLTFEKKGDKEYITGIDMGSNESMNDIRLKNDKDLNKYFKGHNLNVNKKSGTVSNQKVYDLKNGLDYKNLLRDIQNEYRNLTGDNNFTIVGEDSKGEFYKTNQLGIDRDNLSLVKDLFTPGSHKWTGTTEGFKRMHPSKFNQNVHGVPFLKKSPTWKMKTENLDDSNVGDVPGAGKQKIGLETETYKKSNKGFTPEDYRDFEEKKSPEVQNEKYEPVPIEVEPDPIEEDLSLYNDYWNLEGTKPETGGYDPSQYKTDFPFADVLTGAGMAVAGAKMAKTQIPLRNEQVSDQFRNFTAELAKLSQIGLRPEEEAAAKRNLAEAYQSGIEQVVKASGGNRNIVLGNLGRLDYNKQKGLLDISVADAQAKNEALFKYGEAVKYINEFDANRDIANSERRYENAMLDKQVGGQLMASGFQSIMDNIEYYRENKPGSANHAYRSYMYKEMFGVDPGLKDDGTGTIPYTISWKKKQDEEKLATYYGSKEAAEKAMALSPENKKIAQKVMVESGGNTKIANGIVDYLYSNGSVSGLDLSNMENAVKSNDYSLLFKGNDSSNVPNSATNPIFGKTTPSTIPTNKEEVSNQNSNFFASIPEVLKPIIDKGSDVSPQVNEANNAKDRYNSALENLNNYMSGQSKNIDISSEQALKTAEENNIKMINGNVGITQNKAQIDKNITDWFGSSELARLKEEKLKMQ